VRPMTRAVPVCGNRTFSKSDQPGERFSTREMARARARGSPERTAEIRVEFLSLKVSSVKHGEMNAHLHGVIKAIAIFRDLTM